MVEAFMAVRKMRF
jgi:hypothetical protein